MSIQIDTNTAFQKNGCPFEVPPIYVYQDTDGDVMAEWIFDNMRFVWCMGKDPQNRFWHVVSKEINAGGPLKVA